MPAAVGTRFTYWWLPSDVATFALPTRALRLSDFDASGLILAVLALLEAFDDDEPYQGPAGRGALLDGELVLNDDTSVDRIRIRDSGDRIPIQRLSGDDMDDLFGTGNVFPDPILHLQTLDGLTTAALESTSSQSAQFSGFADDSIAAGIAAGDRFIIAISYTPVVSAGDLLRWGASDQLRWGTDALQWAA